MNNFENAFSSSLVKNKVKRFILFISFVAFSGTQSFAQVSSYYQSALGLRNDSLKNELHDIIKNHTEYPYSSSSTDTWDILKAADRDTVNAANVILLYSGRSVDGAQEYNGGNGWNREHVWAKSRGDFGTSQGAGTDAHHLRACDISVNSTRNNRNFDDCTNCVDVIDEGQNTGSKYDQTDWTFEPRDAVKGDVARMIFYMALRYEGTNGEPDLELTDILQSQTSKTPLHAVKSTLLEWHRVDTVDAYERNRNEVVFGFQNNRNPFIDHPELAEHLWGLLEDIQWTGQNTIGIEDVQRDRLLVYPNPTRGIIKWNIPVEEAYLYDLNGRIVLSGKNVKKLKGNLPSGMYILLLKKSDREVEYHRIRFQ